MLLPISVVDVVGGFWEALFVDGVDTEFCLRLRRSGFAVLRGCRPLMRHRIGASQPRRVLGRVLQCNNHPPSRRYYVARNRIHLARRYPSLRLPYEWLRDDVIAIAFEADRWRKWRACLLGAYDGLRGVFGECQRSL
jgi:rhamnosyltransferase